MTTTPCSSTDSPKVPAIDSIATSKAPYVAFRMLRGALSDNGATPWYATVGLGTPAQELRFMIDTG
ncbi:MAG: hypothetical protein GY835_09440, partial [bacterium]|nr:hypothetical protein [bacterium]